jgi:hypothetical protein
MIAAVLLASVSTTLTAAEPGALTTADEAPRFMLYFSQPLGAPGRDSVLAFGLRLEKEVSGMPGTPLLGALRPAVTLTDFRFTRDGGYSLRSSGLVLWEADSSDSSGFPTGESFSRPLFWGVVAVVGIGASCALEYWPCESKNHGYSPPETPTSPGR